MLLSSAIHNLSLPCLLTIFTAIVAVRAQQFVPSSSSSAVSSARPTSLSSLSSTLITPTSYTTYTSVFATTLTSGQARPSSAPSSQSIFLATATVTSAIPTPTSSTSSTSNLPTATSTTVPSEQTLPLHTTIDPAFGILGALLILSGLALAFIGHRSRWLICLISGFYSLALITICVILRVGVSKAQNDPTKTLKGLYLLASICAGGIGGALAVIFRNGGLLLACALGGFTLALFLEACKSNGLIETIGLRYILYVALGTLTFSFACHAKLQSYVLIGSSSLVGATATMLGIDCFTRADLKEFYIRNLGFDDLFVKKYPSEFAHNRWFLSTSSIIQLGVLAGLTIMAVSFQSKMWSEFRISLSMMQQDDEERRLQSKAKRAAKKVYASAQRDLRDWEERHGYRKTAGMNGKMEADMEAKVLPSSVYEDQLTYNQKESSMSLAELKGQNEISPVLSYRQSMHYEPTMARSGSLNSPLAQDKAIMSDTFGRDEEANTLRKSIDALTEQQKLLEEIAMIRNSIGALRSATPEVMHTEASTSATERRSNSQTGRLSSASLYPQTREERSGSTASPWIATHVGRSRSVSGYMQTGPTTTVNDALFAGSYEQDRHNQPMRSPEEGLKGSVQRASSPPPQHVTRDYLGDLTRPLSALLTGTAMPEEGARLPRETDYKLQYPSRLDPLPLQAVQENRATSTNATSLSSEGHDFRSNEMARPVERKRSKTIADSKEEAAARYARALHRNDANMKSPIGSGGGGGASTTSASKRAIAMSVGELQARHQSRLKAMQQPTNAKMEEDAKLIAARDEWARRKEAERRRWEEEEKKQRNPASGLELQTDNSNFPEAPSRASVVLDQMTKQSGTSRAREWRKSLVQQEAVEQQQQQQQRSITHSRGHGTKQTPLLDFTADQAKDRGRAV
ncbi:hypothetical protein CBS101457_000761 [Exobasidium rhododendri]|nr:hypothetical protein CBS101457_000761 [Exobasidium rhododendri]